MVTVETVTKGQIRSLRTEALIAGDNAQVELCDLALGTWSNQPHDNVGEVAEYRAALIECVRVIADAEAQGA